MNIEAKNAKKRQFVANKADPRNPKKRPKKPTIRELTNVKKIITKYIKRFFISPLFFSKDHHKKLKFS